MDIKEFISTLGSSNILLITVILILLVILINGWTDAPNAIATCVSTRSLTPKQAILMAAIFNFLGVLVMTIISPKVLYTISNMVDFGSNTNVALIALCAAMVAIVVWALFAWAFGIPTSESHALIAGISGAAIAINNGLEGINYKEWLKVIYGLIFSLLLGFILGFIVAKLIASIFAKSDRKKSQVFFQKGEVVASSMMAFMHGAQDGQKFMGVFLLSVSLSQGINNATTFQIPIWLMIFCSVVMALGTSIGGGRIIKKVGMNLIKLETYQGFASDLTASFSLLLLSTFGIPVSTTHMKTSSIMGVGTAKRFSAVKWNVVKEMVLTWILTFPGCGMLGYFIAKLFITMF